MSAPNKFLIYQDETQFIILLGDNTYEVITRTSPTSELPEDVYAITPRGLKSALKGYIYDSNRKKRKYYERKEKKQNESTT
jgi:hypothetical protein